MARGEIIKGQSARQSNAAWFRAGLQELPCRVRGCNGRSRTLTALCRRHRARQAAFGHELQLPLKRALINAEVKRLKYLLFRIDRASRARIEELAVARWEKFVLFCGEVDAKAQPEASNRFARVAASEVVGLKPLDKLDLVLRLSAVYTLWVERPALFQCVAAFRVALAREVLYKHRTPTRTSFTPARGYRPACRMLRYKVQLQLGAWLFGAVSDLAASLRGLTAKVEELYAAERLTLESLTEKLTRRLDARSARVQALKMTLEASREPRRVPTEARKPWERSPRRQAMWQKNLQKAQAVLRANRAKRAEEKWQNQK